MITEQEALCYIRLTLKEWKCEDLTVSFEDQLAIKNAMGLYWWGDVRAIELKRDILSSFQLFKFIFLHELCHFLDHQERGDLRKNGRRNAHGANFNKWCAILKIRKGRFVPQSLLVD